MLYLIIKHAHSGLRWIVFLLLIYVVLNAVKKLLANEKYSKGDKIFTLITTIFAHIQLLLGLVLYFISDKVVFSMNSMRVPMLRFFLVEHVLGMLIAITFITIGSIRVKRAKLDKSKHARAFIFFLIALVIILFSIPWPWKQLYSAGWF
jgi:hypothetical protein